MVKGGKVLAALLASILLVSITISAGATEIEEQQEELENVEAKIDKLESRREASQEQLTQATSAYLEAKSELESEEEALQTITDEVDALDEEISDTKERILIKQADLKETKVLYGKRLRNIYMRGQVSYLDVLLGAKDFSDFASRMYLFHKLVERDLNIMTKLKTEEQELMKEQDSLEKEQAKLQVAQNQQEEKKSKVATMTAKKESLYEAALADKEELDAQYEELKRTSEEITARIKQLQGGSHGHGTGQLQWPIEGEITSHQGWRVHPVFGDERYHSGMDIVADYGDPICAADDGVVIEAGWIGGYGNCIMIDHGGGMVTLYGHNDELLVGEGDSVSKGQVIAKAGSTGYSTGPHCHFEVRINGEVKDPEEYLP